MADPLFRHERGAEAAARGDAAVADRRAVDQDRRARARALAR